MKLLCTTVFTLAITTTSFADIYQYSDCDGNGTLLLTEQNAEPSVDLSGLYLGCADLSHAYLTAAILYGANLNDAYLTGAILYGAILYGANLNDADLTGATLTYANLTGASLNDADLYGTVLWQTATWTGATYNDATIFPEGMDPEDYGMIYEVACCVTSGCAVMAEAMCTDLGGTWTEAGSCDDCVAPPETCDGDINADGVVNIDDLLLLISYFGNTCM